jgi:hypothetical protein
VLTVPLTPFVMLHGALSLGVLESETAGHLLLTGEI